METRARSTGRMPHMVLALEAMGLAMRCRLSHPRLATVFEAIADTAIAEERVAGTGAVAVRHPAAARNPSTRAERLRLGEQLAADDLDAALRASLAARNGERTADNLATEILADLSAHEAAQRIAQRTRDEQDSRALTGDTANDAAAQQRAEETQPA